MTKHSSPIQAALDQAAWLTANLPIRLFGDPVLTTPCRPVTVAEIKSGQARQWANQLIDFLKSYRANTGLGRGLAANQIGIAKQVILIMPKDMPEIYVNPRILSATGQSIYPETCISSAGLIIGDVQRPSALNIEYTCVNGDKHTESTGGLRARLLLHEIDHMHGKICPDLYLPGSTRIHTGDAAEILNPELKSVE